MKKIFGIGLSRTGTTSLRKTMMQLGFSAVHLPGSILEIERYAFANDTTVSARFEELDLQFSDSKFIYTRRDRTSWVKSCRKWLKLDSRLAWFRALADDKVRRWISESDYRLYGRCFLDMTDITDSELIAAYERHDTRVRDYFGDRGQDLLTLDMTDAPALPYTQLVRFLETNRLLSIPWLNRMLDPDIAPQVDRALPEPNPKDMIQYKFAKVWLRRGKKVPAQAGFQKTLQINPGHVPAMIELGILLLDKKQYDEAEVLFKSAWQKAPNDSRCHKGLLAALSGQNALENAFQYYRLKQRDNNSIDIDPHDVLCCTVIRNEADRLPHFVAYHRRLGVKRFFFVDNASTDGSVEYLLDQPDVNVWESDLSFNQANFGAGWFEVLLRSYGRGQWVLIADADELLVYPDCESQRLPELCHKLDSDGKRAFEAVLLDMYSDCSISETHYRSGQNFIDVCPYFDRHFYHWRVDAGGPFKNQVVYFGGPRQRVFGSEGNYYLSKVPLIKYDTDCLLSGGQHWTNLPERVISDASGCLLHFKFFASFGAYVDEQAARGEHYNAAMQYKRYHAGLKRDPEISFYNARHSVRLRDSQQLVDMGIMRRGHRR